jgi:hypothetical protein
MNKKASSKDWLFCCSKVGLDLVQFAFSNGVSKINNQA